MADQMFVNLPVKDLGRSIDFFSRLGFEFNPQLSDENGACMIMNENSFVMFVTEGLFHLFTTKQICDPGKRAEVAISFSAKSREQVDEIMDKVIEAGGLEATDPQDNEWMYGRSFSDPDGHIWALFHMG